jgi:acetyl-CoA C-acetyltransferase
MREVYIVDAMRSPIGKFLGLLSEFSAPEIGSFVAKKIVERVKIDPKSIDEVLVGHVFSAGVGQNTAKQVVMLAGLPYQLPTFNINQICASSLKAVCLGAQSIQCGSADVILAGGIESMSNSPHLLKNVRQFKKMGNVPLKDYIDYLQKKEKDLSSQQLIDEMIIDGLWDCYTNKHMGCLNEETSAEKKITREEQDLFALESQKKALWATLNGKFNKEIVPIPLSTGSIFERDEGIRTECTLESLSALKPVFHTHGTITAGNSSQLSDGACFLLLMSEKALQRFDLKPLAKIVAHASIGSKPESFGLSPIEAIRKTAERVGRKIEEIDLFEINEAFCSQVLAIAYELNLDLNKLNVHGGATALGHPLGASGARILTQLVYALIDRKKEWGIASLCYGGGGAEAIAIRNCELKG